ncbi:MAG: hypothetical protein KAH10_09135 [Flavobacteriales bacterium]|nr:hypothetical protein [Flavobacteriales bacterium]
MLAFSQNAIAQQDNLWTTEFGSRSALVGGAVTASVRDNSAIFYNPGRLGFMKHSNIGLSANIASMYTTYIKDGGGDGINLYHPYFKFVPQFLSGILKTEKIPNMTFTYAVFNKHQAKLNFRESYETEIELYSQYPGDEKYHTKYEYFDDINETWVGVGAGYLLSEKWSVGLSMFFAYKYENSFETIENSVYDKDDNLVAESRFNSDFRMTQLGMIFKIGLAYEDDYISWGGAITSSNIPTLIFDGASIQRLESVSLPGENHHKYNIYNDWADSWFRTPWEFDTGVQFLLGKGIISGRVTYFTAISPYSITKFDNEAVVTGNSKISLFPDKNKVMYSSRSFINFALGFERELDDNITMLTGFKVDRNAFDAKKLDRSKYWVPTKSYWNLYTATLGFDYVTNRDNNLIFGISYRFTNRKGDTQMVNLTDPNPNNYLLGTPDNSAQTNINGLALILGYTYNFSSPSKKDIRDRLDVEMLNPFGTKKEKDSEKD